MAMPDYQSLMLPILEISAKGESSVPLAADEIAGRFGLTNEEREQMLPSGKQRVLHNRLHWAKFYLTKAGLLESPKRGRFVISEAGKQVLTNPPSELNTKYLLAIPAFRDFYRGEDEAAVGSVMEAEPPAATPEEVVDAAHKALQAALRDELLGRILQNSPAFFEQLIVELLVAMGYGGSRLNAAEQLGKSGDGGVDGVINEDVLGLDRVYVQAKRHAPGSTIGRPEIQAFTGSLVGLGASKGVFVTTSAFSAQAIDFASRIPQRVVLINGKRLTELMVEHGVGVRISRTVEFKRLDEDFFSEEE
ncbi:MAG: restriction endonuclease [Novosphingobium sp.]|nr:restriction endonuclease [Novosphingobium sp.]